LFFSRDAAKKLPINKEVSLVFNIREGLVFLFIESDAPRPKFPALEDTPTKATRVC
jgi:hypothetical protein